MDSGCHKLSENIWFVWSKMSYSGDMEGCHACGQQTDGRNVNIELEFWKQNSQLKNSRREFLGEFINSDILI